MAEFRSVNSRWWYGVAAVPISQVLFLVSVGVLLQVGSRWASIEPALRTSPGLLLLVVIGGFLGGAVFFGSVLVSLLSPLFVLLDVRAIRKSECPWSPTWAYGLLGLGPLGYALAAEVSLPTVASQFDYVSILFVLTIVGPLAYIYQRRRYVGVPLGGSRTAEQAARNRRASEGETGALDEAATPHPRWWYGVVVPPAFAVLGRVGSLADVGWATLVFRTGALVLMPAFALFLFLDARVVARAASGWSPSPLLWGAIGLLPLVVPFVVDGPFTDWTTVPIALVYLLLRNRRVGLE